MVSIHRAPLPDRPIPLIRVRNRIHQHSAGIVEFYRLAAPTQDAAPAAYQIRNTRILQMEKIDVRRNYKVTARRNRNIGESKLNSLCSGATHSHW